MIIQVDLQRMHVSCDADQAYSEGCCELSSVVSQPVVCVYVCVCLQFLIRASYYCSPSPGFLQCGGHAELGLRAHRGRATCKCLHGQPGPQGISGPKVAIFSSSLFPVAMWSALCLISMPLCPCTGSHRSARRAWRTRASGKLGKNDRPETLNEISDWAFDGDPLGTRRGTNMLSHELGGGLQMKGEKERGREMEKERK